MRAAGYKYEALAERIRKFAVSLEEGSLLPSEDDLMKRFSASRNTLRNALALLRAKGMIASRAGRGTTLVSKAERTDSASSLIMVIAPPHEFEYCAHILDGINDVLQPAGYTMLYAGYRDDNVTTETALMQRAAASAIAGIIVITSYRSGDDPYLTVKRPRMPIVLVDNAVAGFAGPLVVTDDEKGAYDIVSRMIAAGHRRIVYLGGYDTLSQRTRKAGYLAAMNQHNLDIEAHNDVGFGREDGYAFGKRYLRSRKTLPTAVFAVSDACALGFARALREQNIKVPDDISIAGFGCLVGEMGAEGMKISTVQQDGNAVGGAAAQKLLSIMHASGMMREERITMPVTVIDNGTIAAPKMK